MSTRSLSDSLERSLEEWMRKEQEESGDLITNSQRQRAANYDDYLKAQRDLSSARTNKRVSFKVNDEESPPERNKPAENKSPRTSESAKEIRDTAKLLRTMSARKRRSSSPQDAAAWENMVQELEIKLKKLDADGLFKDVGNLKIPFYTPPLQRQRWGDEHTLPIVNHGTLFFDLFFVGAIYNLGETVMSTVTGDDNEDDRLRLFLYFLGIFGSVFSTWENGVYYQSRYLVADYAHQAFDLCRFLGVAAIVLFIRPIQELRDPQGFASVFMLTLALFCESLMQLILDVEVYFRAQGDREAIQNHTLASMKKGTIPTTITYLISTIVAAVFYFGSFEPVDPGIWNVTDIPLTLTGAGYLLSVCMKISATLQKPTGMADIRDTLVPYNIDFVIQRYSDWFLLLIGEVVMAMVETTNAERNFVVTSMGSLIMIVMFSLKFESEPDNPHAHALWRNTRNASAFRIMTEFTSMGMIGMSVIFKVLLAEGRFGLSAQDCTIALTVSLAWVLIALELTLITHKGLQRMWARLFRPDMSSSALTIRSFYWPLALITMWKVVLLIFLLTLPVWQDDPNKAIIFAFFAVWSVAITRIVGWAFIFKEDEIQKIVSKTKDKLKSVAGSDRTISDGSLPVKVMHSFNEDSDRLTTVEEDDESVASMTRQQSETYNGMFDAVIFADFEGSIVSVNNVAVKMFRYKTKSDMIGQNVAMLVGGDHAHKHANYMKRFRERGNKLVFGKQRKLKARRSDGEEFHCLLGIALAGNGKHTIAFIRDLEDFAEDFDLLLPDVETKTEKQLKRVLDDNSFDSIAVIDLDGNIVGVNSTFLKEFRYDSKEEVLGLDIAIIMDSHYQKIHKKMMARYVETRKKGATFQCKVVGRQNLLPVLRKDGSQFKCIIGVSPIEDSDMLVGFIKNVESLMP